MMVCADHYPKSDPPERKLIQSDIESYVVYRGEATYRGEVVYQEEGWAEYFHLRCYHASRFGYVLG